MPGFRKGCNPGGKSPGRSLGLPPDKSSGESAPPFPSRGDPVLGYFGRGPKSRGDSKSAGRFLSPGRPLSLLAAANCWFANIN